MDWVQPHLEIRKLIPVWKSRIPVSKKRDPRIRPACRCACASFRARMALYTSGRVLPNATKELATRFASPSVMRQIGTPGFPSLSGVSGSVSRPRYQIPESASSQSSRRAWVNVAISASESTVSKSLGGSFPGLAGAGFPGFAGFAGFADDVDSGSRVMAPCSRNSPRNPSSESTALSAAACSLPESPRAPPDPKRPVWTVAPWLSLAGFPRPSSADRASPESAK